MVKVEVKCQKCGKAFPLKANARMGLSVQLAYWLVVMHEKCIDCNQLTRPNLTDSVGPEAQKED